jgi:hypothetical protein
MIQERVQLLLFHFYRSQSRREAYSIICQHQQRTNYFIEESNPLDQIFLQISSNALTEICDALHSIHFRIVKYIIFH